MFTKRLCCRSRAALAQQQAHVVDERGAEPQREREPTDLGARVGCEHEHEVEGRDHDHRPGQDDAVGDQVLQSASS